MLGVVEKTRRVYRIGQTRIHLDAVKGLGDFVEIEVVLQPGQSEDDGRQIADDLVIKLGVVPYDLIGCAYIDILRLG